MARVRSGGGGGYAIGMAAFGIGFVICLLAAIVLLTRVGGAEEQAAEARQTLREYVSAAQETDPTVSEFLAGGGTVVGQMLERIGELESRITADTRDIQRLRSELEAAEDQLAQTQSALELAREQARVAQADKAQLAERYQEAREQLAGRFDQAQSVFASSQQRVDELETRFTEEMAELRSELQAQIRELQAENQRLEAENRTLNIELARGGRQPLDPGAVVTADGRIVSLVDAANRVYLDRGASDQIVLGMTFEVFGANELVKLDERGEVRGKATVEVFSVEDALSVARVVRREHGATINEGDQIVNLVYDPASTFKFYVYGQFDMDGDGEATDAERQRIESLIRRWGGEVVGAISYDVDFAILGRQPEPPEELPPNVFDPRLIEQNVVATRNYENYQRVIEQARDLSIPLLNQNRFLALVGFYQR